MSGEDKLREAGFSDGEIEEIKGSPEFQQLLGEGLDGVGGFPEAPSKDGLMRFFRDILSLKDEEYQKISRVGNVSVNELGYLSLPVRNYLSLASYCDSEGLGVVASYLRGKSNIILGTSLSKKAAFLNFAVTQKRVSRNLGSSVVETKKTLFGEHKKVVGVDDE